MDGRLIEFLAETNESTERLDGDLAGRGQHPGVPGLLSRIFRVLHTIEGAGGCRGLPRLATLAHSGGNGPDRFRDGPPAVTPAARNPLRAALVRIGEAVAALARPGATGAGADRAPIAALDRGCKGGSSGRVDAAPVTLRRRWRDLCDGLYRLGDRLLPVLDSERFTGLPEKPAA